MSWGVENLTITFDGRIALDDVSVPVEPGEITAVVGGDGAGKTTLTRALVGLARPDAGTVSRPDVYGFQPATSGTWRDMTVLENLHFVAAAFGIGPPERDRRIGRLLDATQLGAAANRLAEQLSGGMRQKLGVAMALLPEPELLVLDEPTTGVDPVSRLEIVAFIASTAANGTAVLTTTTYVNEAARADYVLALDDGSALASGTPEDVLGSVPGAIFTSATRQARYSWRRGRLWRVWSPDGNPLPDSTPVATDLDDVITIAAFQRETAS